MKYNKKLHTNMFSLIRMMEKHEGNLAGFTIGVGLSEYINSNLERRAFVNEGNKEKLPIVINTKNPARYDGYMMHFKDEKEGKMISNEETVKEEKVENPNFVGASVRIVQDTHTKIKQSLGKFLNKEGKCIMYLAPQDQYVVEFASGDVVAFPTLNIKVIELSLVTETTSLAFFENGNKREVILPMSATKETIEKYLKNTKGLNKLIVKKEYFLAELN